jgi:outer membrane protein TolC
MIRRTVLFLIFLSLVFAHVVTAQEGQTAPRHVTLEEAVQLALKHNHVIRMAGFKVEEKGHAKDIARSAYFPILRNDSSALHVSDTQLIEIPAAASERPAEHQFRRAPQF